MNSILSQSFPKSEPFLSTAKDSPAYWLLDILWVVHATGERTQGRYSVIEQWMPEGSGPPPHVHAFEDEFFWVMEGEMEATTISEEANGWNESPGIYTDEMIQGWKHTTNAVHDKGGVFFLQLWHTGRASHSSFHDGKLAVAPSAIKINEPYIHTPSGKQPHEVPRRLHNGHAEPSWRRNPAGQARQPDRPAHRPAQRHDAAGEVVHAGGMGCGGRGGLLR